MQLVRYNPWRGVAQLESDMEKGLGEESDWVSTSATQGPTTIDMYTEENRLVIEAALTGFDKEEVKISTTGSVLDIVAEHVEQEKSETTREYLLHEGSHHYHRRISTLEGVDVD
jgi:HSP20 family molecular chaperone IbpA